MNFISPADAACTCVWGKALLGSLQLLMDDNVLPYTAGCSGVLMVTPTNTITTDTISSCVHSCEAGFGSTAPARRLMPNVAVLLLWLPLLLLIRLLTWQTTPGPCCDELLLHCQPSNPSKQHCRAHLCDLSALMVASQQRHVCWVSCLEQQQQCEHLQAVAAPVNKVAHEDVACGGHLPASVKQPQQVVELPVNVTTDLQDMYSTAWHEADGIRSGLMTAMQRLAGWMGSCNTAGTKTQPALTPRICGCSCSSRMLQLQLEAESLRYQEQAFQHDCSRCALLNHSGCSSCCSLHHA